MSPLSIAGVAAKLWPTRRRNGGGFKPPPLPRNSEGHPKNRAKLNPIVKTVKIC